jgi:hypothetical protein
MKPDESHDFTHENEGTGHPLSGSQHGEVDVPETARRIESEQRDWNEAYLLSSFLAEARNTNTAD